MSSHRLCGLVFTILILTIGSADTVFAESENLITDRSQITLPIYSIVSAEEPIALYATEEEYETARLDDTYRYERLTYMSDGLEVVAFLYSPTDKRAPMPAIVFNRGSYIRNGAAPDYLTLFHRLAKAGFIVLAPMYRGSEGAQGRDEMGGGDLNDLMIVPKLASELAEIDPKKLFLYGESRGGMMVTMAIRAGFPALAASTFGSPTNFFSLMESKPQYAGIADQLWPAWRDNPEDILGARSSATWGGEIKVPLLIMHGEADESMPLEQSLSLAAAMEEAGQSHRLQIFEGDNHVLTRSRHAREAAVVSWFNRFMP